MATIQKIQNKKGTTYRAIIRKAGLKPITKTFKTRKLAVAFAQRVEGSRETAEAMGAPGRVHMTLTALIVEYLDQYTKKDQNAIYRLTWWSDHYGSLLISDVNPMVIKEALRRLASNGRQGPTLNRYRINLSAVFNYAMDEFDHPDNPCHKVKSKPENAGRDRHLSTDERVRLLTACRNNPWNKLYLAALMALVTGCRRGELLGLRWSDIDFTHNLASLRDTKTGKPRKLPLTPELVVELQKFREIGSGLLFPSDRVKDKPREFRKQWYKALIEADITEFHWHDLRHTCASMLAADGASLLEIGEVLGHTSTQTTARYAHLVTKHKAALVNRSLGNVGVSDGQG